MRGKTFWFTDIWEQQGKTTAEEQFQALLYAIARTLVGENVKRYGSRTSVSLAQATGENGESIMKKSAFFEDAPKGKVTIIEDFLPPPSQLVRKQETVRVTSEFTKQK
jgi:hypothetical protein